MIKYEMTADDAVKLRRAYDDLSKIIELTESYNREHDIERKPSGFVVDAHRCLSEVLFGE